ncbi:MAG: energy transducer TonB [Lentisphaerae bacterium]|nr:energy transducer TonB [Lentisphaerota bacterium]
MSPVGSRRDRIAGMALAVALHLAGLLLLGGARSADTPARLAQPASTRVTIHMPAARPTIAPPAPAAAPVQTALPRPEQPPPPEVTVPTRAFRPPTPAPRPTTASTHPHPPTPPVEEAPPDVALVEIADTLRESPLALPEAAAIGQVDLDGDHDVAPHPLQAIRPVYPYRARQRGESGRVVAEVTISAEGRAEKVTLVTGSGYGALDHAAREALRTARFEPARRGTHPVASRVRMTIIFQLKDAARE